MCRCVSNSATRDQIEKAMQCQFVYPDLYSPNPIIRGSEEVTLSVITSEASDRISFAIWGMLPSDYNDEWVYFQEVRDTLSVEKDDLSSWNEYSEAVKKRRCLVIVTGYFVYHFYNGSLYPYYIHQDHKKTFCLAGIYNVLDDGFKTCSLLKSPATGVVASIQNVDNTMPIIIDRLNYKLWLDPNSSEAEINHLMDNTAQRSINGYPVAKEFFKNDIVYESILEPVAYPNIPFKTS